jgi:hypothetical protein
MSHVPAMQNAKVSDIVTAIPALTDNGSNWSIFKLRFRLALSPHGLYHSYTPPSANSGEENRAKKPVNPTGSTITDPKGTPTEAEVKLKTKYEEDLPVWERNL